MTDAETVRREVADAHRRDWARVLAATMHAARDLELAEECVQEAYATALDAWPREGIPANTGAWLTTIARRRAMDALRRDATFRSKLPLLVDFGASGSGESDDMTAEADAVSDAVPDERLGLIFLACHPALAQDAQLALALRLVCGVSTADIARMFLVSEPTMAARITRAKKKISHARIAFRMPPAAALPARLRSVLGVIHLLFTTGHTAPSGSSLLRSDLVEWSLYLARMLRTFMPDEPDVAGLLALVLVTDARRATRADASGALVRLEHQDRSRWDRAAIEEARSLLVDALRGSRPGRYALQAAIALEYAAAPTYDHTDWRRIVTLYDALLAAWPSPVVALNRAVAVSFAAGPAAALAEVEALERDGALERYQYLPAIKADLLRRMGRDADAARDYRAALDLAANEAERAFLQGQIEAVARVE
jgi:RNA polymerase sigma factor (sigma-70 family)